MIDLQAHRFVGNDARSVAARTAFPVVEDCVYLNTASVGAVSSVYAETLARCTDDDVSHGRALVDHFEQVERARSAIRDELVIIANVEADQLVLTQGTTSGIATVVDNLRWQPGDEVICTDLEHDACRLTIERAARHHQLDLRVARVPRDDPTDISAFSQLISSRTKLIAFSETTFEAGFRLPVKKIVSIAKSVGALTLIDAAQAFGVVNLKLRELEVDFCAMPLQKWLCGPEGLGALYVRPGTEDYFIDLPIDRVVQGLPVLEAALAQLCWQRSELGWEWIYQQIAGLARHANDALGLVPRSRLLTPANQGGLTTLGFDDVDTDQMAVELEKRKYRVRHLPEINAFRIATACFNTREEINALAGAMTEIVDGKP